MSELGHSSKSTPAQRAKVRRLRAEGVPVRTVAEQVFGDVRYRGRVERIAKRSAASGPTAHGSRPAEDVDWDALSDTEQMRVLVDRTRRRLLEGGKTPTARELKTLFEVERQLESREQLDRLNALTRERRRRAAPPPEAD